MPVISLHNVTKAYGTQVLVENASLTLSAGDRVGVVGANGTGKTTLLRLMAGQLPPDRGDVHIARGTRIGYLEQEPEFRGHGTVLDAAMGAFQRVHELEAEIARLREQAAKSPPNAGRLLRRQGELEHEFERLGGYTCRPRADAVLAGVGFRGDAIHAPARHLSGGERSRLAIAHLLLEEPDLLLLDEPTNHLDVEALEWLEEFLRSFRGAAVVVSHDRRFLDGFAERILDIEDTRVESYKGNYTAYTRHKAERVARHNKLHAAQQAHIAKEQSFIGRYIAGQRGREARGRRKRLERMELVERRTERRKTIHVRIQPAVRGGNEVLNLEDLGMEYNGRCLFSGLSLQVLRGERIGVVGPNGAGKTTLIRLIVGEQRPTQGVVRLGHNIHVGYYRQDRLDLNPDLTVLDQVWMQAPGSRAGEMRSLLGLFLFTEDDVFKRTGDLSGGEQARLALAKLILGAPNFLLLDEPTNHLDIPSRQCLEDALEAYGGTALIVSHDRYVLERAAGKILEIKDGRAKLYPGPYSRYAEVAHGPAAREEAPGRRAARKEARPRRGGPKARTRPLDAIEPLIIEREEAIETLQHAMSDPEIYKSPETVRTLTTQLAAVREELAALYQEWDEAADAASEEMT
jgi:ATP-binding cassette subfamily F protein 3